MTWAYECSARTGLGERSRQRRSVVNCHMKSIRISDDAYALAQQEAALMSRSIA